MESNENETNKGKRSTKRDENKCSDSDSACGFDKKRCDKGPTTKKRLKKDDSGINVMPESDNSDDSSDSGANIHFKTKNSNQSEPNSPDSGNLESCSTDPEPKVLDKDNSRTFEDEGSSPVNRDISDTFTEEVIESCSSSDSEDTKKSVRSKLNYERKKFGNSDLTDVEEQRRIKEKDDKKYDPTPKIPRPAPRWSAPLAAISRQYGTSSKYSPDLFRYNCYGSLHMVEKLELMYKMKKHDGCVNALNFNSLGTKLVTGSDDLDVVIWDWTVSEPILVYNSGHTSNVFQAKFMPFSGDCHVVTCARDGQVRIAELSSTGTCKGTRKLGQHRGAAHKMAVLHDSPHIFLSCAEDGLVYLFDLRVERRKDNPQKLITFMENKKRVPLYTLAVNPQRPNEYVVGGRSPYVKVFDTRFQNEESACLRKFCPEHLMNRELRANVTSAVYNYNGEEILASYNEDIYLFSNYENDYSKYLHRYRGHRNSQTIKGVNFFGAKSQLVVSGSDCGYIFFWDKETEHIVKYMYGDEMGVVNCIEPHPHMPVLATSGLDDDIKIWVPSCENEIDLSKLKDHVIANMKRQEEDSLRECSDAFLDQTILFLMQHLSSARARRRVHDPDSTFHKQSAKLSNRVGDQNPRYLHTSMAGSPCRSVLFNESENQEISDSSSSDSEFQDDDDDDDSDIRPVLQCSQS